MWRMYSNGVFLKFNRLPQGRNMSSQSGAANRRDTPYFLTLDGLRGVAALAVVFAHTGEMTNTRFFMHSFLAVDLFFILSGFVLCSAYETRLLDKGLSIWQFILRRLIRLYPLYVLFGLISLVRLWRLVQLGKAPEDDLIPYTLNLFFIPSAGYRSLYPLNYVAWSLAYELVINVIYALCLPWLRHARVLGSVIAVSAIGMMACVLLFHKLHMGFYLSFDSVVTGLTRVSFSFFAGVALARLWQSHKLVLPPAMSYLLLALWFLPIMLFTGDWEAYAFMDCLVLIFLFPPLVYAAACSAPGKSGRIMAALGTASYAIYIMQVPLMPVLFFVYAKLKLGPSLMIGFAYAAFLFVTALVVDRFYDFPVRRWLNGCLQKKAV